jgi:hypothetical protein
VLAQEIAIWAIVGVALLLVAAMIWRGEGMPKIETYAHDKRPDDRHTQVDDAARPKVIFDERAWLAINRYGHDGGGQSTGPVSQASEDVADTKKVDVPTEGSPEGAAEAADAPTSGATTERAPSLPKVDAPIPEGTAQEADSLAYSMPDEGLPLIARRTWNEPPIFRVLFEETEIGSISMHIRHGEPITTRWHWGVNVMPLMDHGGHVPSGDADTFEDALRDFKVAFTKWHAGLAPGLWKENRDHMKAGAERWRK